MAPSCNVCVKVSFAVVGLLVGAAAFLVGTAEVEWKRCNITNASAVTIPCDCGRRCSGAKPCVTARVSLHPLHHDARLEAYPNAENHCLNEPNECPSHLVSATQAARDQAVALISAGTIPCYDSAGALYTERGDHTGVVVVLAILAAVCLIGALACPPKAVQRPTS